MPLCQADSPMKFTLPVMLLCSVKRDNATYLEPTFLNFTVNDAKAFGTDFFFKGAIKRSGGPLMLSNTTFITFVSVHCSSLATYSFGVVLFFVKLATLQCYQAAYQIWLRSGTEGKPMEIQAPLNTVGEVSFSMLSFQKQSERTNSHQEIFCRN